MVRLGFVASILTASLFGQIASAQVVDGGWEPPHDPTEYGAGYKIVLQSQEHTPNNLDIFYPIIASPLSADAKVYNSAIAEIVQRWENDIGFSKGKTGAYGPNTVYSIDCEPGGGNGDRDSSTPPLQMLPDVISMTCMGGSNPSDGAGAFNGSEWGYNWLLTQHRPVNALDIFSRNSGWLKALNALAHADVSPDLVSKPNFADSHRWVLTKNGLGFAFMLGEVAGYTDGGSGAFLLIPWSKLRPYLNPHGIVPRADWNATLPAGN